MKAQFTQLVCLVSMAAPACESSVSLAPIEAAPGDSAILEAGEGERGTGWWPAVHFDANDEPHLTYCDAEAGKLRYATRKDGRWHIETPVTEGNVGKYSNMAIDAKGTIGVVFYDQDNLHLNYGTRGNDGRWSIEKVAWGLETGMASELRYDGDNRANLFYYNPAGRLVQARRQDDGEWQKIIIDEATSGFSARIAPVWRPDGFWISFVNSRLRLTTLFLARPSKVSGHGHASKSPYDIEQIDEKHVAGWRSRLFFQGDAPSVLFTRSNKKTLHQASLKNGEWTPTLIARDVGNFAAAATPNGLVVAYQDAREQYKRGGTVRMLRQEGDIWQQFSIDPGGFSGDYLAVATNKAGQALIAYSAADIKGLRIYDETGQSLLTPGQKANSADAMEAPSTQR